MQKEINAIEIEAGGIKVYLDRTLLSWRNRYAEAQAKSPAGLKSNPYHRLKRDGKLTADFILGEAALIEAKTSKLSAGERAVVRTIMDDAIRAFLQAEGAKLSHVDAAAPAAGQDKPKGTKVRKSTTVKKTPAKAAKTAKNEK